MLHVLSHNASPFPVISGEDAPLLYLLLLSFATASHTISLSTGGLAEALKQVVGKGYYGWPEIRVS